MLSSTAGLCVLSVVSSFRIRGHDSPVCTADLLVALTKRMIGRHEINGL